MRVAPVLTAPPPGKGVRCAHRAGGASTGCGAVIRLGRRTSFLALTLLLIAASVAAQPVPDGRSAGTPVVHSAPPADAPRSLTQYVHRAWTAEDGLPYNAVWSITKTRDGYLWVGTRGGLARFDGAGFVTFTTRNTAALRSNGISALYEDADGTLWIGTLGGLTRYRDGRFTTFTTADGLPGDNVWALGGAPDGTLWIGTLSGLARYRDGRFTTFTTADGLLTNDVRAVSPAEDGTLWFGTYGGGAHRMVDGRVEAFSLVGAPPGPWVHRLLTGRNGQVWVGVGQGQADRSPHQLLVLEDGRYRPLAPAYDLFSVRGLHEEEDGGLWIATYGGGLLQYNNGVFQSFTADDGLTDDRVQALYEDPDGNLWVGTMGGLDLLRRSAPFTTYATEEGLPADDVRAVTQDASGAIWIATAGGLARLDAGGVTALTTRDGLPESFVQSLWAGRNGEVWLGGQHSVSRYAGGVFTRYELPADGTEGVVRSIVEDQDGRLWLGSVGGGLIRFSPDAAPAFAPVDGLAHNSVTTLLAGREGRLWIGTSSGLNLMTAGQVRRFDGEAQFAGINVRSLYEDAEGTLWVGTYVRGLMRYRDGQVFTYTTRDGLYDDGVWSILEDEHGSLWMSTDRGVFRVSKADLEAVAAGRQRLLHPVVYGVSDGMKTAETNGASKPSGWRSQDGRMWFATQRGVVVVDPEATVRTAPAPVIEGVRTRDREVERGEEGSLALPATARDFTISYTSLSLTDPERVGFRYRLDGFSDGWVEAEARREAVFTNVPSGRYAFRVAARYGNEDWIEAREALELTIAPFFWETTWFRLLVAFFLVSLVGLAVIALGRRQRHREAALEALVDARTDELRRAMETTEAQALRLRELDALKSRLFANVSHEFRTPLTLTLGPLDDVLGGEHGAVSDSVREQLTLARRSAARVLDLINQILDVTRLEAGKTRLCARPLDLGVFVEALAQPFRQIARRKAIAFDVNRPSGPLTVWADPPQLEKVFVNLLSNAFKFTPEGGTVRVTVAEAAGRACVTLRDSGPGIPAVDLPHVFDRFYQIRGAVHQMGTGIGLTLAREVADLHGGTLSVESEVGFGSTFSVTLPLGNAHLAVDQIADGAEPWTPDSILPLLLAEPARTGLSDFESGPEGDAGEEVTTEDITTVLVVEDHVEMRAYIRRHLESDYRVIEAVNGREGLDKARAFLPDLVLSDIMMPEMDGYALCRALKADPETDFIPVVLLTAKAASEDRLEGWHERADDYLVKPFAVAELRARVENLIESRRRLQARYRQEGALGERASATPALWPREVDLPSADAVFLERVHQVVEAAMSDEDFSVEQFAEEVGLSRSQLHRRLHALLDRSPSEVLRVMRLERSAQLLRGRAGSVSEVAYAVGYKSVAHFSNAFLDYHGCRPSAYPVEAHG